MQFLIKIGQMTETISDLRVLICGWQHVYIWACAIESHLTSVFYHHHCIFGLNISTTALYLHELATYLAIIISLWYTVGILPLDIQQYHILFYFNFFISIISIWDSIHYSH